jgi:hypothetical protein
MFTSLNNTTSLAAVPTHISQQLFMCASMFIFTVMNLAGNQPAATTTMASPSLLLA